MMLVKTLATAAAVALLLAGCTGLKSTAPTEQLYVLRPAPVAAAMAQPLKVVLQLRRPGAQPGLDTERIALALPGHRLDYYAGARWSAPLPQVTEALFLQSLRGSGRFAQVSGDVGGVGADYLLAVTLRRFEAEYTVTGGIPTVQLQLECVLVNQHEHRQVASFDIVSSAPAAANRQESVVAAFEQALQAASQQLVERTALQVATALAAEAH
jgi:cholesterol transport system auxiliary component